MGIDKDQEMGIEEVPENSNNRRQDRNWAKSVGPIHVNEVPPGATNLNVEGRQLTGPLHGFGQLWKKTYQVRLEGFGLSPEEVMRHWKDHFQRFQPAGNTFHFTERGANPGEVIMIDANLPTLPGTPGVIPLTTGVMVMYEDEVSFTVTTPEGHPEAGWNTFSTFESDDGCVIAQIQGIGRAADPIYEFGLRFMGGTRMQEQTWQTVLANLAQDFGISNAVTMQKECIDPRLNWKYAGNVWKNAAIRTFLYKLSSPIRAALKPLRKR